MGPMSDSPFYKGFTPSQSGPWMSQQTFLSDIPLPPPPLQRTTAVPTNIITCLLCQEIFLDPVIFPCGHTFCLACSEKWRKEQRVCPQAGCDQRLGEAVPNLLVKEAAMSHHARRIMEANQQQEQSFLSDSEWDSVLLEQTCTGGHHENMPPAHELPPLRPKQVTFDRQVHQRQEATQPHSSITSYIFNKAFVRGTRGRRTETHQMPSRSVFFNRLSLRAKFSSRPKEERMNQNKYDDVWMGDEQQDEAQKSSDFASHPMNKLMQAKKDKSLWKRIFSSNKAKK